MYHRIHIIKVPTNNRDFFPYSHYSDINHDPFLQIREEDGLICLFCEDLFKLKPNVQQYPKNRIDIYLPHNSSFDIADELEEIVGTGTIAAMANASPEYYRRGRQTLPIISDSRKIYFHSIEVAIAGYEIRQYSGSVYLDCESPNEGHIEMKGPEVHFGIPLDNCTIRGGKDETEIIYERVPDSELRVGTERNPIPKARGAVRVFLDVENARSMVSTLRFIQQS